MFSDWFATQKTPRWLEHAIILGISLVWTAVALLALIYLWGYQDAQARLEEARISSISSAPLPPAPLPAVRSGTPSITSASPTGPTSVTETAISSPQDTPFVLPETPLEDLTPEADIDSPPYQAPGTPGPAATLEPNAAEISAGASTPITTPVPITTSVGPGPTRLVIESVNVDTPVVPVTWKKAGFGTGEYSVWEVADFAAGWHVTSAPPGQNGNTVLAGHHNINGEVFRYLVDVQEGDEVKLYVGDVVYRYQVEQKLIVKETGEPLEVRRQNAQWIAPTQDERVTLVTCWPYTNNTHRVIVVARPIE